MHEFEQLLKSLINKPNHTSISLTWNEDHSYMYQAADGNYEYDSTEWVSQDEYLKAMTENSVWCLRWYPNTPIVFHCIKASSIQAIIDYLEKLK